MPTNTFFRLRDEKQESVLRAAIHQFTEHGFSNAKIAAIALEAKVAKGSIYQYFADKKELFVYCAQWGLEIFMKKLDERMHIGDMDVFEYFEDNVGKTETIDEERELVVFMQAIEREPDLVDASLKAMYGVGELYGKMLIQNSKRKGTVRDDIDDDLLLIFFLAVSERFKFRWMDRYVDFTTTMSEEQACRMKEELRQMLELMRKGMGC